MEKQRRHFQKGKKPQENLKIRLPIPENFIQSLKDRKQHWASE